MNLEIIIFKSELKDKPDNDFNKMKGATVS